MREARKQQEKYPRTAIVLHSSSQFSPMRHYVHLILISYPLISKPIASLVIQCCVLKARPPVYATHDSHQSENAPVAEEKTSIQGSQRIQLIHQYKINSPFFPILPIHQCFALVAMHHHLSHDTLYSLSLNGLPELFLE